MNRNYVFKNLLISLFIIAFLCSCGEKAPVNSDAANLFQYAVETEKEAFAPKGLDFFMSVEETLQITGLSEDAVSEGASGKRISATVNISGFPDDILTIYSFSDDQLVTVEYIITVDDTEAADLYNLLYEQAISAMPAPTANTMEGIKEGKEVAWEDQEQNYVRLSFPGTAGTDASKVIILGIYATHARA